MEGFEKLSLPNGMEAYFIRMSNTHSVVISIYVRAGIRYEDVRHIGVSHLIEHLLFRRLDTLEQRQLYHELECIGTTLRATTYADFIRFYVEVLPQFAEKAFHILKGIFRSGNWTAEDIRKEKKVVLNQMDGSLLSYGDRSRLEYWAHSSLGNPIMGTPGKIKRLSNPAILKYYNRFFQPQNSAIIVSGNFSEKFARLSQMELSKLNNGNISKLAVEPIFPKHFGQRSAKDDVVFDADGNYADVRICFEADHHLIKREAVEYLHRILGDGDGSRLSILLREEAGLVDEIYSELELHSEFCVLSIQYDVTCDGLLESLKLVNSVICDMIREISDRDINASIHFMTSNWAFDLDSPEAINFHYGWRSFILGEQLMHPEELSNCLSRMTADELRRAAENLFKSKQMSTSVYCNQERLNARKIAQQMSEFRAMITQGS